MAQAFPNGPSTPPPPTTPSCASTPPPPPALTPSAPATSSSKTSGPAHPRPTSFMGMKKVMNSMGSTPGSRITHVEYANGDCEELLVTPVGPNLYRLEESTLFGEPKYHDVIEAETLSEGRLRFIRSEERRVGKEC